MRVSREPQTPRQQALTWAKLSIAVVGLATFFYGIRIENDRVRWFGVGMVAVAFILRWIRRPT